MQQNCQDLSSLVKYYKAKILWKQCSSRSPRGGSLLQTQQYSVWEAYVGVKRSRKANVSFGGHCQEQWKSSWISGNVFSRSRYVLGCGQDSKVALLPEIFQIGRLAATANSSQKDNFSTVAHGVLHSLSNSDQWNCYQFSKDRVFTTKYILKILADIVTYLPN